jgi:ribosomal protein S18 acetylase RimI-like enzyme
MFLPSLTLLLAAGSKPRHVTTSLHHRAHFKHHSCRHNYIQETRLKSALHVTDSSENIVDNLSYRPVSIEDISRCYEIESSSYPSDEAASLEKLKYRQQYAGEYFMCATKSHSETNAEHIIGYICSTRCNEFTEESMSVHDASGSILAIHSVVVDAPYRRQGVASAMMDEYLKQMLPFSNLVAETGINGFSRILLLAKSNLLSFYVDNGFMVLRPSPIDHGQDIWYELEARRDYVERLLRLQTFSTPDADSNNVNVAAVAANSRVLGSSRSTSNPDYAADNDLAAGRSERRSKLHEELNKLGIDPNEMEHHPEQFGTAAMRTYNSFLLPKVSFGILVVF